MTTPFVMAHEQCANFEKCVLPLATRPEPYAKGRYVDTPTQYWQAVAKKANVGLGALKVDLGDVRRCECGAPIGSRKRYCDSCQKRHRRETNSRAAREGRNSTVSVYTVKHLAVVTQQ